MLFKAAVFASVYLHHSAVINLGTHNAGHLEHLQEMWGEFEAAALARLRAVGADVAEVVRSHRQKMLDAQVFHVEWQLELLLQQTDGDFLELERLRTCNACPGTRQGKLVDDALELVEYGFDVVSAGLNLNLAELAGAIAEENSRDCLSSYGQRKNSRVLHVCRAACRRVRAAEEASSVVVDHDMMFA